VRYYTSEQLHGTAEACVEMRKKFRDAVGEKKLENGTKLDGGRSAAP
jgi:hypothetical protein